MVDVFEEVNEDLKNEEFALWLKKFAPRIIAISVLLVLFTAGRVIHTNYKSSVNQKQTAVLNAILDLDASEIEKNLSELDRSHKFMADFLSAASYSNSGDLEKANEIYESIIDNNAVSSEYKEMAKIYVVQNILNMDNGDLDKAQSLIKTMSNKENAFYYIATEQNALIELKKDNVSEAKKIFEELSNDYDAPDTIRVRAEKLKTLY